MIRLSKILLLLLLPIISSCTKGTRCHQYAHVRVNGWYTNDTLTFDIPATDSSATYDMDIELRTTPSYEYKSLTVVRQVLLSHPSDTLRDTVCISTSENGRRLSGEGVTTQSFAWQAPALHIDSGQNVRILLHHIMANGPIKEVMEVGIKLKHAQSPTQSVHHAIAGSIYSEEREQQDGEAPQ